ncbi:MAG: zf-HC2 domain-containing protein [Clostridia bacterium]|nr:zf-HC2 domain-containing protein [Clostridia bacterium]
MNHDCEIIQDLMPLVIDEVSSDQSRQAVEEHVKECPDCARVYEDLKTDLMGKERKKNKENHNENSFIRKILKKKRFRRILKVALLVLLALLLVAGVINGVQRVYNLRITMSPDEYEIRPVQMKNGDIAVIVDYKELNGSNQVWGINSYGDVEETYGPVPEDEAAWWQQLVEEGNAVYDEQSDSITALYTYRDILEPQRTCLGISTGWTKHNQICMIITAESLKNVKGYNIYNGSKQLVWSYGDPVPQASEELEEYCRLEEIRKDFESKKINAGFSMSRTVPSGESKRRQELMRQHLAALEANLPELQPWIGEKPEPLDEETFRWAFYGWQLAGSEE